MQTASKSVEILLERPMTTSEVYLAKSVFGHALDCTRIKIHKTTVHPTLGERMYHSAGHIYLPGKSYKDDLYGDDPIERSKLVHELAHVWQYQNNIPGKTTTRRDYQYAGWDIERNEYAKDSTNAVWDKEMAKLKPGKLSDADFNKMQKLNKKITRSVDSIRQELKEARKRYDSLDARLNNKSKWGGPRTDWMSKDEAEEIIPVGSPGFLSTDWGRPLSEILWERADVREMFNSREHLLQCWRDYERDDYDYMKSDFEYTVCSFEDLNIEQQATMIQEYYLLSVGIEVSTTRTGLALNGRKRPPLSFYRSFIPFLSNPLPDQRATHRPLPRSLLRH